MTPLLPFLNESKIMTRIPGEGITSVANRRVYKPGVYFTPESLPEAIREIEVKSTNHWRQKMLKGFEVQTAPLDEDELKAMPFIIRAFEKFTKEEPITAQQIIKRFNQRNKELGLKLRLSDTRLRKIVNHIRTNSLLPLCSSSKGYYVSRDKKEIERNIKSLQDRAYSIYAGAIGLEKFMKQ